MSEIAACTLIQEKPDRKTERYLTMFKDYPDVVTVEHLQDILDLFHIRTCRKIVRYNLICVHIQNRRNIALAPRQIEL